MGVFARYMRIANDDTLPTTANGASAGDNPTGPPPKSFGRARTRWLLIIGAFASFLLLLFVANHNDGSRAYLQRIASSTSRYAGKYTPSWMKPYGTSGLPPLPGGGDWVNGSGRTDLSYSTPFNPDDLTLTEEECDAFFPGLWREIDRSVSFFTKHPYTKAYLEEACDDGEWTHARVVIYNNHLYIKYYQQSVFTRSNAALAYLYQAVTTSRERIPNVEFCIGVNDWGSKGKFSLDRAPHLEDLWLMPDYGWYAWPEPGVGSYSELREKTARIEQEIGWEGKKDKLFWRGAMGVGTADREAYLQVAGNQPWSDSKALDWHSKEGYTSMEDHCRWKFFGFPEGMTYSGRLRYLQNCRSVIVTHEPRWIQHWTHMYNADWNSPDQNIVFVPEAVGPGEGVEVHDQDGVVHKDRTWERLPETMEKLLADDAHAKRIADNQWNFFRERYVSPASAACYWRKLLKGFHKTQRYTVDLSGNETSYETFMLLGHKLKQEVPIH